MIIISYRFARYSDRSKRPQVRVGVNLETSSKLG